MIDDKTMDAMLRPLSRYADDAGGPCHRKNVVALATIHGTRVPVASAKNTLPVRCMDCRLICPRARGESRRDDYSDCPSIHAEVNLLKSLEWIRGGASDLYQDFLINGGDVAFDVYVSAPPCRGCMDMLTDSPMIADIAWVRRPGRDDHVPVPDPVDGHRFHELKEDDDD